MFWMLGELAPVFVAVAICMTIAWVSWVKAKHGGPGRKAGVLLDEIRRLEAQLESRDASLARLEERVRVLERIVTDRKAVLRNEIDRLSA